jgi:hypothetical protein
MATLKAAARNKLPSSDFGMPGERKYPMPDKGHAKVAKSYASKEEHAGKISQSTEEKIGRKADRVLGKGRGDRNVKNARSHGAKMRGC